MTLKKLQKGDVIGIVSPAGFIKEDEDLSIAISLLQNWGLKVKLGKHVFAKNNHFAGTDLQRKADFQSFLDDDNIKSIWCTRGGYGSIRIINDLDFTKFKVNPKWIIGYSDITVFHNAINGFGLESIHAIMPTSTDSILKSKSAIESLRKVFFGEELSYQYKSNKFNKLGKVEAKIIGGNLSLLASLTGTKFSLNTTDKILFIEEIGEYKYQIDRMLQSLKLNGYFKNCKGLILGGFTKIKLNEPSFGKTIEELILDVVKEYDFPICFDFEAGHITNNKALILGRTAVLNVEKEYVSLDFE